MTARQFVLMHGWEIHCAIRPFHVPLAERPELFRPHVCMADTPDKQELNRALQRAANGDEQAWHDIVTAYSPRVFGLLRSQCGNADLAEEITQSAFCTLAAKIGSYSELGKFEAWLFRIAINRLRDEIRRRKRQANPVEHNVLTGMAGAARNEDEDRPEAAQLQQLRDAMAQLSDAEQQIIHLRHSAELSFKQIADILDQPLGTALARHHRAVRKLKDIMGEEDEQ
jgi:RNA polymerase sigma-70 factor (ECF subfamily)